MSNPSEHRPVVHRRQALSRRDFLHVGSLGAAALLGEGRAEAVAPVVRRSGGRAKSCILLFLNGGPPQHETWDPKPDAPDKYRGDLKPIATTVPGLMVGELMPRIARLTQKTCVLRSLSIGDNVHGSSHYRVLTGQPHTPVNIENVPAKPPNDCPSLAAIVNHLRSAAGPLPAAMVLPGRQLNAVGTVMPCQDYAGAQGW
jgi:hypothetical protein